MVWDIEDVPAKHAKHSIAELSRPNQVESENARQKHKEGKKGGHPQVHRPRDAVYHNQFSPFLWSQILLASKAAGWQMSPSAIHNWLQKKDPAVFGKISSATISGWIDRSGDRPKWSENALQLVEIGNHQHHLNGGHCGALVSSSWQEYEHY
jgi:hypothetical protein